MAYKIFINLIILKSIMGIHLQDIIVIGCVQQNVYFVTVGSFLCIDWIILLDL